MKNRKDKHIEIALTKKITCRGKKNGFEKYDFNHMAFLETNYNEIDTSVEIMGKKLSFPFMITALTGGSDIGEKINKNLGTACEKTGIALGLGSQKVIFKNPSLTKTFYVRDKAPNILLFGNLGIHHLNEFGLEACKKIVNNIKSDGLAFYLNPLHEVIQTQGKPLYKDIKKLIKEFCLDAEFPVIIKETGNGISKKTALLLKDTGIKGVDIAGAGGTSCAILEYYLLENKKEHLKPFFSWGIPTAESLLETGSILKDKLIIASGGIRNGIDCAKAIAMGADMAGMALPFLEPATVSSEKVIEKILEIKEQFKIAMFCGGAKNIKELKEICLKKLE